MSHDRERFWKALCFFLCLVALGVPTYQTYRYNDQRETRDERQNKQFRRLEAMAKRSLDVAEKHLELYEQQIVAGLETRSRELRTILYAREDCKRAKDDEESLCPLVNDAITRTFALHEIVEVEQRLKARRKDEKKGKASPTSTQESLVDLRGLDMRDVSFLGEELSHAALRRADLSGARFKRVNLMAADLKGANFRKADLSEARLWGVKLNGANLQKANLKRAHVDGTDLRMADFSNANLQGADLEQANLERAELKNAYLQEAHLIGANFRGANLQGAVLKGADLRWTRNLTQEQLDQACGDNETKLPEGLTIPKCEQWQ